jgi:mannose/fructose/N-acetylgalactosamine-specific phosphotransferase system component IIC
MVFVVLGVIAGFLAVDQRAGWQGLLAQPVFAGFIVGLVLGEIQVCVWTGVCIELVYLSVIPMRGARVSDQIAAGVTGAGTAGLLAGLQGGPDPGMASAVGVFIGLLVGEAGSRLTALLFALHNRFLSGVEFSPDTGHRRMARRLLVLHASSVGFIFAVESLLVMALGAVSYHLAVSGVRHAGNVLTRSTLVWGSAVVGIGVASIIHLFWHHRFRNVVLACAVVAVIILWLL